MSFTFSDAEQSKQYATLWQYYVTTYYYKLFKVQAVMELM